MHYEKESLQTDPILFDMCQFSWLTFQNNSLDIRLGDFLRLLLNRRFSNDLFVSKQKNFLRLSHILQQMSELLMKDNRWILGKYALDDLDIIEQLNRNICDVRPATNRRDRKIRQMRREAKREALINHKSRFT